MWYHGTIRRYIVLFGTIFNQIYITRTDEDGAATSQIRIPITYGPADKVIKRVESDPNLDRPFGVVLPYMTFQILRISYDEDRHLKNQGREVYTNAENKDLATWVHNSAPYNFLFELNIIAKNAEDAIKAIEQLLPFFTPTWTATVEIIDEPLIRKDIPLRFIDHDLYDSWTGSYEERRYIHHTLRFEMHGHLFGPLQKKRVIKQFEANFTTSDGEVDSTIVVYPGLTVDGLPTSDPTETVSWHDIDWTDDFGFVEVKTAGGEEV